MVCKWVVCCHGPGTRGNVVNLDVKIGADSTASNTINLTVKASGGVEVSRNSVRRQARVIGIANRVVAPKRSCGIEVLVHATKQIDISAVACSAEPASRL